MAWWGTRNWPQDLHNAFYVDRQAMTEGTFDTAWWDSTRRHLHHWRANRGVGRDELDRRFARLRTDLIRVWQRVIEPRLSAGDDITSVSWDDVRVLPELAAEIKHTKSGSGVFPSKFSHFIAPQLFPVLDRTALPGSGLDYGSYFMLVQETWAGMEPEDQQALRARLTSLVQQRSGGSMVNGYPIVNKIVELRLIGRRHPTCQSS
ncbi:hypothetical protein C8E87_3540 [Paractinoplanes brasiliensis]|uniref:Uncharacterized protein n=1 Tax=Paractinoplanes brasiliensis TaxID=52695 RepID=A0A4R6JX87_9ACTN|nr:hypothetical protein C8E87_3540 [Actinoplanes brasiliensis]